MSSDSLADIVDLAFANKANHIENQPQTAYGEALQRGGNEHTEIFNKMVRANMGFSVKIVDQK